MENNDMDWTPIIIALITSVGVTSLGIIAGRRKNNAETQNVVVSGEIMIGKEWAAYAQQQKLDKEELRKEFKDKFDGLQASFNDLGNKFITLQNEHNDLKDKYKALEDKYNALLKENNDLKEERQDKLDRIIILEGQVEDFKKQLEQYQTAKDSKIDHAKEDLHKSVEDQLEGIKH